MEQNVHLDNIGYSVEREACQRKHGTRWGRDQLMEKGTVEGRNDGDARKMAEKMETVVLKVGVGGGCFNC